MKFASLSSRQHLLWIPFAALIAVMPLIVGGTSCGHDFPFHVGNWIEVQQQWSHGVLLPRWHFAAAWNAGEPRFLFYPPLTWILGALLGTVLPWSAVPVVFTWIALTACGLTVHRLVREYVSLQPALFAACFYLCNPYMLFVAYERTAYGELLSAVWMPLLLMEALRERIRPVPLGIAIALLWLTNAPAAVVSCYSLAMLVALRLCFEKKDRLRLLRDSIGGTALGLALAAFYILPAAWERRFVEIKMAVLPAMRPWQNFLFGHTGQPAHLLVLHQASFAASCILVMTLVCIATALYQKKNHKQTLWLLLPLSLTILFLLTPLSSPIWHYAPQLIYLQFPWRFIAMAEAVCALSLALALPRRFKLTPLFALLLAAALGLIGAHLYRQPCHDDDSVAAVRSAMQEHRGIEPTDEYTPLDADNEMLAQNNPAFWTADSPNAPPNTSTAQVISITSGDPYDTSYRITAGPRFFILNQRAFYGWHILLNDQEAIDLPSHDLSRDDGLLVTALPADRDLTVRLVYRRTLDQYLGFAISLLALLLVFFMPARRKA